MNRKIAFFSFFVLLIASALFLREKEIRLGGVEDKQVGTLVEEKSLSDKKSVSRVVSSVDKNKNSLKKKNASKGRTFRKKLEEEENRIWSLAEKYPENREALINRLLLENPFRKAGLDPHSLDSWREAEWGAVKVVGLRLLMEKELDSTSRQNTLEQIIHQSQDPGIVKVAQAVLEHEKKGRSFFRDFPKAVLGH